LPIIWLVNIENNNLLANNYWDSDFQLLNW